jgi:hypothetical protein
VSDDPSAVSNEGKRRLIIHGGFGKCGSSSIQRALFQNITRLRKEQVYMFNKHLEMAQDQGPHGVAHRFLAAADENDQVLAGKVATVVGSMTGDNSEGVSVLSAESLVMPRMSRLFAGIDQQCDVTLVYYVRPQWQWIPSAWQQWFLKQGTTLDSFVEECLTVPRPAFRDRIQEWQAALPAAKVRVRFLISELLQGTSPAEDFLHLLGVTPDGYKLEDEPRNTSLDYAIVHVLSKNPQLFSGIHDNRLRRGLRVKLAKKFQSANIRMLSREQEARIEEYFRDENLWLLKTYGGDIDVEKIYNRYFIPSEADVRYSDLSELDLVYRCLGIILEAIATNRKGPRWQLAAQSSNGLDGNEDEETDGDLEAED